MTVTEHHQEPAAASTAKPFAVPDPSTLLPPRDDPITVGDLATYTGQDASKPIYVAIKGRVYDVSRKREVYGPGGSYHVFAGKDASRALGRSSLDPNDISADYSVLTEEEMQVLNDWESFFQKRYNIVGKVVADEQQQ